MNKFCLTLVLFVLSQTIKVPVNANHERCMVVFSYASEETIKLHLKFPKAKDQADNEFWYVTIENTETQQKQTKEIAHGHYRQQLVPQGTTVYNVCFIFSGNRNEQFLVDFESFLRFNVKAQKIKVPQTLSKVKDVRKTYKQAEKMIELGFRFLEAQNKRNIVQDQLFIKTAAVGENLITMLRVEILVLAVLMVFQVLAIRRWVKQRAF